MFHKKLPLSLCLFALISSCLMGQPTDNPAKTQYNADGYPAWTDQIAWDNVIDVTSDPGLSQHAVANESTAGAANFAAFEEARDLLHGEGGGVIFFPSGTYHFELPDMGYGSGIGPLSRGLMLKSGVVIRGDALNGSQAIIRNPDQKLDTDYDLEPTTIFVFPFQKRGTVPSNATGVDGEAAGTASAAGETPTDWNFVGITPGTGEAGVSDVTNVGLINVTLEGGTIVFGFDTNWAPTMATAKWEGAKFKVDWPAGSAANNEDWIHRAPNGEHYGDLLNGRDGWHQPVDSGSGRLVMNVKMVNGAPWMDFIYADRKDKSSTAMSESAFSHYRFAGRLIAYGSNIFIGNNVIAKPTRNFVHVQKQNVGDRTILFDYANHLGVDINKSLHGANQENASVHVIDGEGYYASNVVVRDNWVFNRGNKGFEVSGRHMVIQNNHNERYVAANRFPYEYITNPDAYPTASEGGDIDAGGISFEGFTWQSSESADDYLSRGFDLAGMDVWVDNCTVINTGSRGNDGEAILGQRHNGVETLSWAITNSKFGPYTIDDSSSSSSGANAGYIGPYDMHSVGLFLAGNEGPGAIGILKPENNYMLDLTWFNNNGSQATPGSGHSDDWIAPGEAVVPHSDPVEAPTLTAVANASSTGVELSWIDTSTNELGFRVDRRINSGDWKTVAYRPRLSASVDYPDTNISSARGEIKVGDVIQTQWTDYLAPLDQFLEYRVVAINQDDDASTGVSNIEELGTTVETYTLTVSLSPDGLAGSITGVDPDGYSSGSDASITAVPEEGYEFLNWSGDASGSDPTLTIAMDGDKQVTANFAQIIVYSITMDILPDSTAGSVTGVDPNGYVDGANATLSAEANDYFVFTNWSGDLTATDPEVTLSMDGDKSITANFVHLEDLLFPNGYNEDGLADHASTGPAYGVYFPELYLPLIGWGTLAPNSTGEDLYIYVYTDGLGWIYSNSAFPIFYHYDRGEWVEAKGNGEFTGFTSGDFSL